MASKKNIVILEGGLTRDPEEFANANVVHLSLAVDNAGSEKGVQYASGYFDLKVWLNDSDHTPAITAKTVRKALDEGTLKKGSRIAVIGRLNHERWEKDDKKNSKTTVIVDSIDIYTPTKANNPQNQNVGVASSTNDDEPVGFVPQF